MRFAHACAKSAHAHACDSERSAALACAILTKGVRLLLAIIIQQYQINTKTIITIRPISNATLLPHKSEFYYQAKAIYLCIYSPDRKK